MILWHFKSRIWGSGEKGAIDYPNKWYIIKFLIKYLLYNKIMHFFFIIILLGFN